MKVNSFRLTVNGSGTMRPIKTTISTTRRTKTCRQVVSRVSRYHGGYTYAGVECAKQYTYQAVVQSHCAWNASWNGCEKQGLLALEAAVSNGS